MGIKNDYDAFCFNEAVAYIKSFMYYDYEDEGKQKWSKEPHWIDDIINKSNNNEDLIKMLQHFHNNKINI